MLFVSKKILVSSLSSLIIIFSLTSSIFAQNNPEISFETTFRADWAYIDRPEVYDTAATAMDDGQWKVWNCGEKSLDAGQDAIFFTSFNQQGNYDVPTTRVLVPQDNISSVESLHTCAPSVIKHSFSQIEAGQELYKLYYECAPKIYEKSNPSVWSGAFTQICHAVSEDGIKWQKWNKELWDNQLGYGNENTEPTPVIKLDSKVIDNCDYEFIDGKHQADLTKCIDINNYGVGHPSALVMDLNGSEPDGEQIWLFYYDSKGDWYQHGVYLAKSWDGFHFETPVRTNLKNPIDVKYFNLPIGDYNGVFIGTLSLEGNGYFAYSYNGINWEWPNFADNPSGNYDQYKIGTAIEEHCTAPDQPAIVGNKHGISHSWLVNLFSGEGFLGTSDGGKINNCYSSKEDESRGSTWGLYVIQGKFFESTSSSPSPSPSPTSSPLPGDLDDDNDVDIFDYNTLVSNFGATDCGNAADTDSDCDVDIFDYNTLISNFGSTT